ncbi:MAG: outer membrane biosynthesis protein TonB, partial [Myxococcota bacterium]
MLAWMIAMLVGCEAEEPPAEAVPAVEPPVAEVPVVSSMPHCADPATGASEPCLQRGDESAQLDAMARQMAIKTVLRSKSGQVKYCYEQRLKENPNISGRIAVEVSIAAGRVTSAVIVENTTGDSALEPCVIRTIRSWRFSEE